MAMARELPIGNDAALVADKPCEVTGPHSALQFAALELYYRKRKKLRVGFSFNLGI